MRIKLLLASIAAGALFVPSPGWTQSQTYVYNVGPNYVNMSGNSCRPIQADYTGFLRYPGHLFNIGSASSTKRVFCPINRRNTQFYTTEASSSGVDIRLTQTSLIVEAERASGATDLRCQAFWRFNGSIVSSDWKYLCSTAGGCTSGVAGYSGHNTLSLQVAFGEIETSNFGVICDVPGGYSYVANVESAITPNN